MQRRGEYSIKPQLAYASGLIPMTTIIALTICSDKCTNNGPERDWSYRTQGYSRTLKGLTKYAEGVPSPSPCYYSKTISLQPVDTN